MLETHNLLISLLYYLLNFISFIFIFIIIIIIDFLEI